MPYPELLEQGGKAPCKLPPKEFVVEPAPSHDGAPCFAAYTVDRDRTTRPQFALRIYDTTPAAGSPDRIRDLALKIHRDTEPERCDNGAPDDERHRIEIVGLPLREYASEKERVQACMAHHLAEVSARRKHHPDFYLPATSDGFGWWREILVLERLEEGWDDANATLNQLRPKKYLKLTRSQVTMDPLGSFISVRWDSTELARRAWEENPRPEAAVTPYAIWQLGHCLGTLRKHIGSFRSFVMDGGLERELRGEAQLGTLGEKDATPRRSS